MKPHTVKNDALSRHLIFEIQTKPILVKFLARIAYEGRASKNACIIIIYCNDFLKWSFSVISRYLQVEQNGYNTTLFSDLFHFCGIHGALPYLPLSPW